jgi:hypothetical protein
MCTDRNNYMYCEDVINQPGNNLSYNVAEIV